MNKKDWTGNNRSAFTCNGARNYAKEEREEHDYYATEPKAVELLLEKERFSPTVWECACGEGHIAEVLKNQGYDVVCSDIYDRGYEDTEIIDFLEVTSVATCYRMDIITNPPYKFAKEFVEKALEISADGTKIAMFLKLTFLEGKARRKLFMQSPPRQVLVFSERILCAKNGEFERMKASGGSAVAYAWFVWEKGYNGKTTVEWI
jgi:hypothetical protein